MSTGIFSATAIPALEQVINFTESRHNVLAGNIANMDTPGYHTRDLSVNAFQSSLRHALAESRRTHQPLSPGDLTNNADPVSHVRDSMGEWLHHDDTNASLEGQVTAIAKNQLQHNTALAILTSQFRLLGAAINERA
jgi:flagellar basal-body rod protein FlgB